MSYDVLKDVPPTHSPQINCWWESYKEIEATGGDVLALEDFDGNEYLSYSVQLTPEMRGAENLYLHVSEYTTEGLHSEPMDNGVVFDAQGRYMRGGKSRPPSQKKEVESQPKHLVKYFVGAWITVDFYKLWEHRHESKTYQDWIDALMQSSDQPGYIKDATMSKLMEIAEDYDNWLDSCVQCAVKVR